jgi:hypothetical protein
MIQVFGDIGRGQNIFGINETVRYKTDMKLNPANFEQIFDLKTYWNCVFERLLACV